MPGSGNYIIAQALTIPRDTSYTVVSTLKKIRKEYKAIEVTAVLSNPSPRITIKKDIIYSTIAKRKLTADLFYLSKPKHDLPCIVMIHGGGWRAGDKSLNTPMAERLADAGYVVMSVEYRLSLEATYPAAVQDLYDAIAWIDKHARKYHINMNKLAVLGCSAGGQLAALVGTTYNKPITFNSLVRQRRNVKINAIVDIDGILAFKHPDSQEGKVASEWLGGTYEEKPEAWTEASALTHVDAYTPPTLFIASKYPRFLAGRQEFISTLDKYGTKYQAHFLENAPHSFWLLNPWFEPTVRYVIEFLDEVFK